MPNHEWCRNCPLCFETTDVLHLYVDESECHVRESRLVLGLFATRHVGHWGRRNVELRVNLGRRPLQEFHFSDITRSENCPRARLGRDITHSLSQRPLQFYARGFIAPFTERDDRDFKSPSDRLRFYIREFAAIVTRQIPTEAVLTISNGPHGGDGAFLDRLQTHLDEISIRRRAPRVRVAGQETRHCLLLQVADLTAGCTRQIDLGGRQRNPNKIDLALYFNERLRRQNRRFDIVVWDWDRFHGR